MTHFELRVLISEAVIHIVWFEVLAAVWLKIKIFWDVKLCRFVATDVSEGCSTFNLSD
jgi:hypothetical protein